MSIYKDSEIQTEKDKWKQGIVTVLKGLAAISSSAAWINPIFGVAGQLIRVGVQCIDDEDIDNLRREFDSVHSLLDKLSEQHRETLEEIRKAAVDQQYARVEQGILSQFRKYNELLNAQPQEQEYKINEFLENYKRNLYDQHLHTLYDGVVGKTKIFSQPILDVYMKHSKGNRQEMESLCQYLSYLFRIGLTALMGYTAIKKKNEKAIAEEWSKKMEHVKERMEKVLNDCDSLSAPRAAEVGLEKKRGCSFFSSCIR